MFYPLPRRYRSASCHRDFPQPSPHLFAGLPNYQEKFNEATATASCLRGLHPQQAHRHAVLGCAAGGPEDHCDVVLAEPVDAATPADTYIVELKEKEAEVVLPYAAPFTPFVTIAQISPIAPVPYTIISPLPVVPHHLVVLYAPARLASSCGMGRTLASVSSRSATPRVSWTANICTGPLVIYCLMGTAN